MLAAHDLNFRLSGCENSSRLNASREFVATAIMERIHLDE